MLIGNKVSVLVSNQQSTIQGVITVYAALQLALLILFSTTNTRSYDTAIGAAALSVFGSTTLLALSWAEHSRSLRPSILLTFYLTLTLLLDIVQARTLLIISPSWVLGRLFTAAACLKGVILLLENYPKTSYAFHVQPSPEASMGIFSIATYAWLGRLVVLGSQKTLNISDLYDLDPNMASEDLDTQFWVAWNKPSSRGRKLRLAVALVRATKWQLLAPVPPRIARTGLNFCQPFLIQSIQTHLLKPYTPELDQQGKGLIGATVLVYLGIAMSIGIYQYYNRRAITFLRGFLVAGIYRKTVTIEALGACGT
jgi:hypothetical protein